LINSSYSISSSTLSDIPPTQRVLFCSSLGSSVGDCRPEAGSDELCGRSSAFTDDRLKSWLDLRDILNGASMRSRMVVLQEGPETLLTHSLSESLYRRSAFLQVVLVWFKPRPVQKNTKSGMTDDDSSSHSNPDLKTARLVVVVDLDSS
jgi:hypothetical protein